ncbi:recombinase family protein [Desulfobacca acetoxidans]
MAGHPKVIGYLRVITQDQDLEKNKAEILAFADERKLGPVEWLEEKVSGVKLGRPKGPGQSKYKYNLSDTLRNLAFRE